MPFRDDAVAQGSIIHRTWGARSGDLSMPHGQCCERLLRPVESRLVRECLPVIFRNFCRMMMRHHHDKLIGKVQDLTLTYFRCATWKTLINIVLLYFKYARPLRRYGLYFCSEYLVLYGRASKLYDTNVMKIFET